MIRMDYFIKDEEDFRKHINPKFLEMLKDLFDFDDEDCDLFLSHLYMRLENITNTHDDLEYKGEDNNIDTAIAGLAGYALWTLIDNKWSDIEFDRWQKDNSTPEDWHRKQPECEPPHTIKVWGFRSEEH